MKKYDFLIVGAGLFGATFAAEMTKQGKNCLVIDRRNNIGGNVYCENKNNIIVHKYGAHIFHTNNKETWDYINKFAVFNDFINSPIANYKGELYHLPFNMNTFTELWPEIKTPSDAQQKINSEKAELNGRIPNNLEEQAISLVGRTVYEKLIKGYTEKQWGKRCTDLPPSIIKRIPVRFTFDNNYFNDKFQGIPIGGYNQIIEKMLAQCDIMLNTDFLKNKEYYSEMAGCILYTGTIDEFYNYQFGPLEYRSLKFDEEYMPDIIQYQSSAVVNYTDEQTPYTRVIEHKHFEKNQCMGTVITKEYPANWTPGEEAYYPINDNKNTELFNKYRDLAKKEQKIIFGGRLGNYEYNDMDKTIEKAISLAHSLL